jgi:hypothetical protein
MEIEDITRTRPAALPGGIVIPCMVEVCRETSENTPSADPHLEEYIPVSPPQPGWPRVFPGL